MSDGQFVDNATNSVEQWSKPQPVFFPLALAMAEPPLRLLNFVSESELDAERENGVAPRREVVVTDDRPLYQILKENQDKKDAEFNERFKHRPPKALDEEETDFLEALETYKKQQEQEAADDEARQLTDFHTAIASRTVAADEVKSLPSATPLVEASVTGNKRLQPKPTMPSFIKIKPQPKKAKIETVGPATDEVVNSKSFGLVVYSDESDDEEQ